METIKNLNIYNALENHINVAEWLYPLFLIRIKLEKMVFTEDKLQSIINFFVSFFHRSSHLNQLSN